MLLSLLSGYKVFRQSLGTFVFSNTSHSER